jgi:hypothetical protein
LKEHQEEAAAAEAAAVVEEVEASCFLFIYKY